MQKKSNLLLPSIVVAGVIVAVFVPTPNVVGGGTGKLALILFLAIGIKASAEYILARRKRSKSKLTIRNQGIKAVGLGLSPAVRKPGTIVSLFKIPSDNPASDRRGLRRIYFRRAAESGATSFVGCAKSKNAQGVSNLLEALFLKSEFRVSCD
jgi:hypothetical protein